MPSPDFDAITLDISGARSAGLVDTDDDFASSHPAHGPIVHKIGLPRIADIVRTKSSTFWANVKPHTPPSFINAGWDDSSSDSSSDS
jgi:hypothetical protein